MKILYRPHCGSLSEAMAKAKEFISLEELFSYLVEDNKRRVGEKTFDLEEIYVSYYCYDERIDWDTYVVCIINKEYRYPKGIGYLTFKE